MARRSPRTPAHGSPGGAAGNGHAGPDGLPPTGGLVTTFDRWVPSVPPGDPPPGGAPPRPLTLQDRPPRPPGPPVRPAAMVLGLAVVLFVGGSVALGLSGSTAPQRPSTTVRTAPGSPLPAVPAAGPLSPIEVAGQPPTDIVAALAVPEGSTAVPGSAQNVGVETYDRVMAFTDAATQAHVVGFFRAELKADGWQQISTAPAESGAGVEVLGQHGGSDGNTWEVGVVVHPTTFGPTGTAAGTTTFSLELYIENTDD